MYAVTHTFLEQIKFVYRANYRLYFASKKECGNAGVIIEMLRRRFAEKKSLSAIQTGTEEGNSILYDSKRKTLQFYFSILKIIIGKRNPAGIKSIHQVHHITACKMSQHFPLEGLMLCQNMFGD